MTGDGLTVTGGANGLAARFDDLHAQAGLLDAIAGDLGDVASTLARVTISPDVAEAAVLCPIEAARAEETLLAANLGPHGVGVAWARAEASVAFLRFSIAAYQEVDDLLTRLGDELAFAGGFAAGSIGVPAIAASVLSNPVLGAAMWAKRDALLDGVQELAYDEPWTQEIAARSAPGVVEGATFSLLGGSPALLALVSGGHWPASDLQGAMNGLLHIGGSAGLLEDSGRFTIAARGQPERVELTSANFVGEVIRQQQAVSEYEGAVRIIAVDCASGPSYVVQIPGTQTWGPRRGSNPVDLTTNVHLMGGNRTQLESAVIEAMREAHIPAGAPVMLTGHSQGGIVAANIAADPAYRREFAIRAVVTAGSPIGRVRVLDDVAVLSLEIEQDLVPKLEGAGNPDRSNWVTVTGDLNGRTPGDTTPSVLGAHSLNNYERAGEAVDESVDPAVLRWRATSSMFSGPGAAQTYQISHAEGQ